MSLSPGKSAIASGLLGLVALGGALLAGQAWPSHPTAAPANAATVADGARFYAQSCAHCHADDATGDEGPSLRHLRMGNAHFALLVRSGIKGEMPSFAKKYDDTQATAIFAWLKSLDPPAALPADR